MFSTRAYLSLYSLRFYANAAVINFYRDRNTHPLPLDTDFWHAIQAIRIYRPPANPALISRRCAHTHTHTHTYTRKCIGQNPLVLLSLFRRRETARILRRKPYKIRAEMQPTRHSLRTAIFGTIAARTGDYYSTSRPSWFSLPEDILEKEFRKVFSVIVRTGVKSLRQDE